MPETFEQRPSRLAEIKARLANPKMFAVHADAVWMAERLEECAAALREIQDYSISPWLVKDTAKTALATLEALHDE